MQLFKDMNKDLFDWFTKQFKTNKQYIKYCIHEIIILIQFDNKSKYNYNCSLAYCSLFLYPKICF